MQRATVAPPPLLVTYDDIPATESAAATGPWVTASAPQRCWKICADWHQNAKTTIANAHGSVRDPDQAAARAACACAARACSGLVRVPSESLPVRRSMPYCAVPRITHMPVLLPWTLPLRGSRCARVAQMARTIAITQNALLDGGSVNETAGEYPDSNWLAPCWQHAHAHAHD